MRKLLEKSALLPLLEAIGERATGPGSVYLVGGASAVWFGWRDSTVDVDLALAPEPPGLFGAIEALKHEMQLSIELADPGQFVPPLPGWQGRSAFILRSGLVDFYHYDFYSQAFAKLSRGHARDLTDVAAMRAAGKVDPAQLLRWVDAVMPQVTRYPNLHPAALRQRVLDWVVLHGA